MNSETLSTWDLEEFLVYSFQLELLIQLFNIWRLKRLWNMGYIPKFVYSNHFNQHTAAVCWPHTTHWLVQWPSQGFDPNLDGILFLAVTFKLLYSEPKVHLNSGF